MLLTIETCTDTSTIGIVHEGVVLAEMAFPSRHTLVSRLLLRLDWLLGEAGTSKDKLEGIAVSLGPGSFTGVRIGAAAAKVLAPALDIPLVGVSTLQALAWPFRGLAGHILVPVINARRGQVYTAQFRGIERVSEDAALSPEPFAAALADKSPLLIGVLDGLPDGFNIGNYEVVRALVTPHALAALATERLVRGESDDPLTLAPVYLRAPADR